MRIAVTGALGYVGSRLVSDMARAMPSVDVLMIDNRSAAHSASPQAPAGCERFEYVDADVLDADLSRLFRGADAVIHLAALTNGAGADESERMQRVNIDGTERVARACVTSDVPLLFPSTTSVYGVSRDAIADEASPDMIKPQNRYAATKLESEELIRALGESDGLRFAIFRMGTIFGGSPGMAQHTAVNRFCAQALSGEPVEVWRTAVEQRRPYLDVFDASRAMLFALGGRLFDNHVYNVVTVNTTVGDVLGVLSTFVPGLRVVHIDSPLMNALSYGVSAARLASLGFECRGGLAHGIASAIAALAAGKSGLSARRAG